MGVGGWENRGCAKVVRGCVVVTLAHAAVARASRLAPVATYLQYE